MSSSRDRAATTAHGMKVFLDIGAHTGETLEVALEAEWQFDRIICFEPAPGCWESIEALADDRVELCRFGLWHRDERLALHNAGQLGASMSADKEHGGAVTECEFRDAAVWFRGNLDESDLVFAKINVEGAEAEIIERLCEDGSLSYIDHLMIHFDVRKVPSKAHLEAGIRSKLDRSGVQYLPADSIEFGIVQRGTRNWLRWCHSTSGVRDLRYMVATRWVFAARRLLYPAKVTVRRLVAGRAR